MTDTQDKRIHAIVYSNDGREELAERIVVLEDENAKLKNNNNYLHEMLSESRQANEHLYTELKRHKSILRARPNAMNALYDENAKLQERVEWLDGECRKSMGMSHKFFEMVGEYQKENAKLRELVRDMWHEGAFEAGACYEKAAERLEERTRELGIEVDA